MNKLFLSGNLTADPAWTQGQEESKNRCNFRIAYNHSKDKATFFSCTAWGKTAERVNKLKKGQRIMVIGDVEENEWTGTDGSKQRDKQVNVREIDYIDFPQEQQQQAATNPNQQQSWGAPPPAGQYPPPSQGYGQPAYGQPQQQPYPQQQYTQQPYPQQAAYQQPPMQQQQQGYPPQQQFQQPPAGQPPQPGQQYAPPQQQGLPFNGQRSPF